MKKVLNAGSIKKHWKIIVPTVVAAIIALSFAFKTKDARVETGIKDVVKLSREVREFYKNRPDYWGLDAKSVLENSITDKLTNPFEKEVVIGQGCEGSVSMPGSRSFDIAYKNLNKKECIALASYKMSETDSLGLISIIIANSVNSTEFSWGEVNKLPIARKQAEIECSDSNCVIWRFE